MKIIENVLIGTKLNQFQSLVINNRKIKILINNSFTVDYNKREYRCEIYKKN